MFENGKETLEKLSGREVQNSEEGLIYVKVKFQELKSMDDHNYLNVIEAASKNREKDQAIEGSSKEPSRHPGMCHSVTHPCQTSNYEVSCVAEESFAFFDELPNELFVKILSFLSPYDLCLTVAPVCKIWYECYKMPMLWQCLDLSQHQEISHQQLSNLLGRASQLKSLSLRGREQLAISEVQMLNCCPLLTNLNLGFCKDVSKRVLDEIVICCPKLEVLNVEGCKQVDDEMAKHFPSLSCLKVLSLSHCTKITDDGVVVISQRCLLLENLNIDGIPWITDRAVDVLASQRAHTLKAVYLDGAELTDASITSLIDCPLLDTFSLSFCEQLTDKTLSMLETLNHLGYLRLQRGLEFTEEALHHFFQFGSVENLTSLDLSECSELTDRSVTSIACRCHQLKKLALCWCWYVSDIGIQEIIEHCSQLRHFDIVGLHKVKGTCLSRIPETQPHLSVLDLRQCNLIHDSILVELVKNKPALIIFSYYGEQVTPDMTP